MPPDAVYWAVLTGDGAGLASVVSAWLGSGNRSVRGLFEQAPQALSILLDVPEDALAPLVALRARVPQTSRLLDRLEREGVSFLSRWDRHYPRGLKAALGDQAPPALWYTGSLELLAQRPVGVFGSRDAGPEVTAFARALAVGLADQGRPVITGVARAIERAILDTALSLSGTAIVVLGQGIARAQPDLRRLRPHITAGRLLVLAALAPEAAWQPGLEEGRSTLAAALAERAAVAQMSDAEGTWAAVQTLRRLRRPLFVREAEIEAHRSLLADGALALSWPAAPEELASIVLESPGGKARDVSEQDRTTDEALGVGGGSKEIGREAGGAERAVATGENTTPGDDGEEYSLEEALLHHLRRSRRRGTGKGELLETFACGEAALDRALLALIAAGKVKERPHRSGASYAAVRSGDTGSTPSGFQLSLFGQDEPS